MSYHLIDDGAQGRRGGSLEPTSYEFSPNDKVSLNFGQHSALIDPASGSWKIPNLENGRYIVTVDSQVADYGFYMVEVKDASVNYFRYNITSRERTPLRDFSSMKPFGQKQYFEVRPPFNIEGLVKSPTGIMVGITVLLLFCMKNMPSQEELKKMQQADAQPKPQINVQKN